MQSSSIDIGDDAATEGIADREGGDGHACRACSIDLGGGSSPASLMEAKASEAQGRPS